MWILFVLFGESQFSYNEFLNFNGNYTKEKWDFLCFICPDPISNWRELVFLNIFFQFQLLLRIWLYMNQLHFYYQFCFIYQFNEDLYTNIFAKGFKEKKMTSMLFYSTLIGCVYGFYNNFSSIFLSRRRQ